MSLSIKVWNVLFDWVTVIIALLIIIKKKNTSWTSLNNSRFKCIVNKLSVCLNFKWRRIWSYYMISCLEQLRTFLFFENIEMEHCINLFDCISYFHHKFFSLLYLYIFRIVRSHTLIPFFFLSKTRDVLTPCYDPTVKIN